MLIVFVYARVKAGSEETFREASLTNARASLGEEGVIRFDVIQQQDDPTRFVLIEAYRTPEDVASHKQTEHYKVWREKVEALMAEPRTSVKYQDVFYPAMVVAR